MQSQKRSAICLPHYPGAGAEPSDPSHTSVLNVISVVELYFSGNTVATQTYQYFQTFTIIAIIYFVLTFTVTCILRFIERRFDADTYTTGANQNQKKEVK